MSPTVSRPILPGATLGILGGGQLGRMTAMAARSLGYHVHALDPDPSCAARYVVERCFTAAFDDAAAAEELARTSSVVTVEIEKISLESMAAAARHAPVRPSGEVLRIVQDRARQKTWLKDHGFPLGPYREAATVEELAAALDALGTSCFVKTRFGGYDGGGQARAQGGAAAAGTWKSLGEQPLVVERALDIESELSVLVARAPSGQVAVYPPALNHHEHRILAWSVIPGPLPEPVRARALEIASEIARSVGVEGLLVIELFLTRQGELLVNELAPRPHNSFHATEVACLTSQFEQAVRAVCDLPLGSTEVVRPAAIANLLGDLWLGPQPPAFDRALVLPGVRLHLYGKRVPRPGRKMGHLSASGATPEEAVRKVMEAKARLASAS
ncbi:MAG TPA: 5-(carboxyamino)imidazole ribonucleotide synthase [Myxococcaceae bacterium]|nr:5-(carboxyamino)imidazole ribonucleotide synthase [Myxococcaceae bacterium]